MMNKKNEFSKDSTSGTAVNSSLWKSSVFTPVPAGPRELTFVNEDTIYYFKLRDSDRYVKPIISNARVMLRVKDEKTKRERAVKHYKTAKISVNGLDIFNQSE